jgi:hypothetical protein
MTFRTYEDKFAALSLTSKLPVAVLNLEILVTNIGQYATIGDIPQELAVRLTKIADPVLRDFFDIDTHVWVNPYYIDYLKAWRKAGFHQTPNSHLDHLHSKAVAQKQGYQYVLLCCCSGGGNLSAGGGQEKSRVKDASPLYSEKNKICYADELHFQKMWGLKQNLSDE